MSVLEYCGCRRWHKRSEVCEHRVLFLACPGENGERHCAPLLPGRGEEGHEMIGYDEELYRECPMEYVLLEGARFPWRCDSNGLEVRRHLMLQQGRLERFSGCTCDAHLEARGIKRRRYR